MQSILIANRGEIACRIISTCRRLGIGTVAVYSEADARALHLKSADRAIPLAGVAPRDNYANIQVILNAAAEANVTAIHPGYGFLAENPEFAAAVIEAGFEWIGPSPETIRSMGNKNHARDLAQASGLPILPGSAAITSDNIESSLEQAARIGFPLMVKAAAGGGGIGMKRVDAPEQLMGTIKAVQAHAGRLYGDPTVFLEKLITHARHVEIQIFGFGDGNAVHLYERDCSIQRRFQKVIEESGNPHIDRGQLNQMYAAALKFVQQQRYSGAGTVEFLYDGQTHDFYFLEMNTRIQVEHPVTEMVTGLDLVELQIKLALGDPLKEWREGGIARHGHAIECRLYAEDPARSFMPNPGKLEVLEWPNSSEHTRIDTGVCEGDQITPFYDPMIAKVICHGASRQEAIQNMLDALNGIKIAGVKTNLDFLRSLLCHPDFVAGFTHTRFVDQHIQELLAPSH